MRQKEQNCYRCGQPKEEGLEKQSFCRKCRREYRQEYNNSRLLVDIDVIKEILAENPTLIHREYLESIIRKKESNA